MEHRRISEENDGFTVTADIYALGHDVLVVLQGGTPHIGAIGIAEPRQSLADPKQRSATSSVFTFPGHKEDGIAKQMAEETARQLGGRAVVVAGAHWDDISPQGINTVLEICARLTGAIVREVNER